MIRSTVHRAFLSTLLFLPGLVMGAQEVAGPAIHFQLDDWYPKGGPLRPRGQKICLKSIKIFGTRDENGHWRKYFYRALNDQPGLEEELKSAFAAMFRNRGFTVVDDPEVPAYLVEIHVGEADTSGSFFGGMGEAKPIQAGQPWTFKPKTFSLVVTIVGEWRKNSSAMAFFDQRAKDQFQVKHTHKIEPKISYGFLGETGQELMANPIFVENATRCTEGAIRDALDFYVAKMNDEVVNDLVYLFNHW